jgi:hypothetical protein
VEIEEKQKEIDLLKETIAELEKEKKILTSTLQKTEGKFDRSKTEVTSAISIDNCPRCMKKMRRFRD